VLAGKEKGKRGQNHRRSAEKQRVIVEGVQMIKRTCAKARTIRRARLSNAKAPSTFERDESGSI